MSWLQKRPQLSNPTLFFNLKNESTKLIVGLGNIGKEYVGTRHNIGFDCLEDFKSKYEEFDTHWLEKKELNTLLSSGIINSTKVILIKPTTLMNNSGISVNAVSKYYKINPENILVVHDELDIEFGYIRTKVGGSSAGHNGVQSIIEHLKTENFSRLRIGIQNKQADKMSASDFVLAKFNEEEVDKLGPLKKECSSVISEFIFGSGPIITETRNFLL